MDKLDVLDSLKLKEEELDNLLIKAREKADRIKEDALRRAEEIKLAASKEVEGVLREYRKSEMGRIDKEIEAIKMEAEKKAEELRLVSEERKNKAVETAIDYLVHTANSEL